MNYTIDFSIYDKAVILSSIGDFEEVSEISISHTGIIINEKDKNNSDEIFNEFMNYVLSIIN